MYRRVKNPWLGKEGYNCIGCAPHNPFGLHMHFYVADENVLWGEWNPSVNYESWPGVVHGGVQAMMLDEAAEWWINAFRQTAGITTKMEVKFHKPVLMADGPLRVKATHLKDMRRYVFLLVELLNSKDEVCSSAEVVYLQYPRELVEREYGFTGCELEDEDTSPA
ncbi:MAG: PaaI family thioesterase [Bacteroidales bacterium]|nr:PaaI family thioesterase [Bacteroidales bacterium]